MDILSRCVTDRPLAWRLLAHRQRYISLVFGDYFRNIEPGEPDGVPFTTGLPASNRLAALAAKLQFYLQNKFKKNNTNANNSY